MKNIFSRIFTEGAGEKLCGEEFIIQHLSQDVKSTKKDPVTGKMILFVMSQFGKVLLGMGGIVAIGKYMESKSVTMGVLGGIAIIGALGLHFYSKMRMQSVLYQDTFGSLEEEMSGWKKQANIPENAVDVEIMYLLHEPEQDQFLTYMNEVISVYKEDDSIYFVTPKEKIKIPISYMLSIEKVEKEVALDQWNQDTPFDQGAYKKYQIKSDASIYDQYYLTTDYGRGVVIPYYYRILVKGQYEIVIPPYELEKVEGLIGTYVR